MSIAEVFEQAGGMKIKENRVFEFVLLEIKPLIRENLVQALS